MAVRGIRIIESSATSQRSCCAPERRSQFTPEALQRMLPAQARVWGGKVAFIPASPAISGDDLFDRAAARR
jgi:hypothetical protein